MLTVRHDRANLHRDSKEGHGDLVVAKEASAANFPSFIDRIHDPEHKA